MLQHRGDALHCADCGREFDAQDPELSQTLECPSDDCPSNEVDDGEIVDGEFYDSGLEFEDPTDQFDIEYDH